jgi:hypothetical protein
MNLSEGRKVAPAGRSTQAAVGYSPTVGIRKPTVSLSEATYGALKGEALRRGVSISALIRDFCEAGLRQKVRV